MKAITVVQVAYSFSIRSPVMCAGIFRRPLGTIILSLKSKLKKLQSNAFNQGKSQIADRKLLQSIKQTFW